MFFLMSTENYSKKEGLALNILFISAIFFFLSSGTFARGPSICASKLNDNATQSRKTRAPYLAAFIHYITLLFFVFEYLWFFRVTRKAKEASQSR